jgi:iron complex outermembrane recepter protein
VNTEMKAVRRELLLAFAVLATSTPLGAQVLDEVIVTAERRETDLQSTPLAITAVSSEVMEQKGIADLEQLAAFVPNLTVIPTFAYGDAVPKITMRGVGAGGFPTWGIANESAVAIYIDGMYFSRNPTSILSLSEIESVEVLRGPQGTLFGRNTTGGAISYRTFKANANNLDGYGEIAVGNLNERNVKAGINIPLSDTWGLRLAAGDLNRDGQIKRGPLDYGGVNSTVGRMALHGELTDKLTMDMSASYTKSNTNGEAQEFVSYDVPPGAQVGRQMLALSLQLQAQGEAPIGDNDPRVVMGDGKLPYYCVVDDANPYTFGDLCDTYRKYDLTTATVKLNYDMNDHVKLSSLTGFMTGSSDALVDAINIGTWARQLWQGFTSVQQELQINLNYDRWNAVGGVIYYWEDADEGEDTFEADVRPCFTCATDAQRAAFNQAEINRVLAGIPIHRRRENYWQTTESTAAFAQATFSLTDKWDVTGGARYTVDKKDGRIEYLPNAVFEPFYAYADVRGKEEWNAVDYRLSTQYQVTDDFMIYLARSKAYKAGIMNDASVELTIITGNPVIGFTQPEDVVSDEIGFRSEWFDKRLRFNATYFDMTWGNRTGNTTINDENGNPHFVSINQPNVSSTGYELDAMFAITDSLTWTGALSHNKARQKNNPRFVLAGNAEDNWNMGLTHTYSFTGGGTLASSINYSWTGPVYTFDTEEGSESDPNATPQYEFTSARVTYTPKSGNWTVAVYSQNLFDEKISYGRWSLGDFYGGTGTEPQQEMRALPRTVGASFRYNF